MSTIKLREGAAGARLLGLGAYRPRRRVTNDELATMMDTNDEWIQSRVGIAERRWASEDETLVEMAVAAGGKALAASGLTPDQVDLVGGQAAGGQRLAAGGDGHLDEGLVLGRPAPLGDADPALDPLVVGVHHRGELVVGHPAARPVAAG